MKPNLGSTWKCFEARNPYLENTNHGHVFWNGIGTHLLYNRTLSGIATGHFALEREFGLAKIKGRFNKKIN
jgi:hypothetical protein